MKNHFSKPLTKIYENESQINLKRDQENLGTTTIVQLLWVFCCANVSSPSTFAAVTWAPAADAFHVVFARQPFTVHASHYCGSDMFGHNSPTGRARELIEPSKMRKVF